MSDMSAPDVSVIVVSFNTRELLRECLRTVQRQEGVPFEVVVVDNHSRDGSADMVAGGFPAVRLLRSSVNLGFAAANNLAFRHAGGRYVVLLNSDAFLAPGALARSSALMDRHPEIGLAGGRLVGRDGSWQPSARMFPSVLRDFLALSGLSARYPRSRFFGRADGTCCDPLEPAAVDWVPGAYSIIRREALDRAGYFDENFFLYYEEVDLCRRIRGAGYRVQYWPEIVVTHLGGESSKTVTGLSLSSNGSQLALWRMRAGLLYYRKHHGAGSWRVRQMERAWHTLRKWRNLWGSGPERRRKAEDSRVAVELLDRAWKETAGGRVSPARPW